MNKVVYVPAFFEPVGKNKKVKVPTGEKKKVFSGEKKMLPEKKLNGSKLAGQIVVLTVKDLPMI